MGRLAKYRGRAQKEEAIARGELIDADDEVEKENDEAWHDDESDEWRDRGDDQGDPEEDQKHFDPGEENENPYIDAEDEEDDHMKPVEVDRLLEHGLRIAEEIRCDNRRYGRTAKVVVKEQLLVGILSRLEGWQR